MGEHGISDEIGKEAGDDRVGGGSKWACPIGPEGVGVSVVLMV